MDRVEEIEAAIHELPPDEYRRLADWFREFEQSREAEAKQQLKAAYRNFVEEVEPERKNEAGRDLIRAVFGKDSLAEDSVF